MTVTVQPTRAALEADLDRADAEYRAAAAEVATGNCQAQGRMPSLWAAIGAAKDALRDFDAVAEERRRLAAENQAAEEAQALRHAVAASVAAVEEIPPLAVTLARQVEELAATVNKVKVLQSLALAGVRAPESYDTRNNIADHIRSSMGDFVDGLAGLLGRALDELPRVNMDGTAALQAIAERESGRTWPEQIAAGCERAVAILERQLPPEPKEAA